MNNYKIGQIFEGMYPPEAAILCNLDQTCHIDLISDGIFQIVLNLNIVKSLQLIQIQYRNSIQQLIDQTAQSKGYENGCTLATYSNSTILVWKKEAEIFISWRDSVWQSYFNIEQTLTKKKYKTILSILLQLPKIEW